MSMLGNHQWSPRVVNGLYIGRLEKLAVLVFSFGGGVKEKKKVRGREQDDQLLRRMNAQRKERVREQRRREREIMTQEWHRTTYFLLVDLRSTDKATGKQLMSSMSQQMKILIQKDRSGGQLASSVSYEHLRSTARDAISIHPLRTLCVCLSVSTPVLSLCMWQIFQMKPNMHWEITTSSWFAIIKKKKKL